MDDGSSPWIKNNPRRDKGFSHPNLHLGKDFIQTRVWLLRWRLGVRGWGIPQAKGQGNMSKPNTSKVGFATKLTGQPMSWPTTFKGTRIIESNVMLAYFEPSIENGT